MDDKHGSGIAEALRLTRTGRLADATALIQGLLRGKQPAQAAAETPHEPGRFRRLLDGLLGRGKPAPAPEPGMTAAQYTGPAGSRAYRLYVPPAAGPRPLPLLVMLHGCTQNPEDFAAGTRMNELAQAHGVLVAWPEQDKRANAQRCWNWFQPGDQARDRGEPAILAGIVRQIMAEQRVDPARIYVAGLSAGGAQAAIMAAAYPDLFAAVGVHSGLACGAARDLPTALAAMRNGPTGLPPAAGPHLPTILFQGDVDRTVNPANADALSAQTLTGQAGLRTEIEDGRSAGGLAWHRARHLDPNGRAVLERWTVHGAGHAWSGGSPAGSFTEPRGPDASREMLRFFLGTARTRE